MTATPKPETWKLVVVALLMFALAVAVVNVCAGPQLQLENPTELCATAVAMSSTVKAQAAKLGLEPIELARRTCDAAILAAQVAEANLPKGSGIAGGTSSSLPPSMGLAGAAGAAGSGG
jgi:hypothetical protein